MSEPITVTYLPAPEAPPQPAPQPDLRPSTDLAPEPAVKAPEPAFNAAGKGLAGRLVLYGIILVVVLAGGYFFRVFAGGTSPAKVGDCYTKSADANAMKTIDCADGQAAYKVVGSVAGTYGQARIQDTTHPCAKFGAAVLSLWVGAVSKTATEPRATSKGTIVCLAANTK